MAMPMLRPRVLKHTLSTVLVSTAGTALTDLLGPVFFLLTGMRKKRISAILFAWCPAKLSFFQFK
jgi:hypothetical protein